MVVELKPDVVGLENFFLLHPERNGYLVQIQTSEEGMISGFLFDLLDQIQAYKFTEAEFQGFRQLARPMSHGYLAETYIKWDINPPELGDVGFLASAESCALVYLMLQTGLEQMGISVNHRTLWQCLDGIKHLPTETINSGGASLPPLPPLAVEEDSDEEEDGDDPDLRAALAASMHPDM